MREWKTDVTRHLATLHLDATRHASVVEELAQHLEDRCQTLMARGMTLPEAEAAVLDELRENDAVERELRLAERGAVDPPAPGNPAGGARLAGVWQDLRYAARVLRKGPGFTAVAAVTLALGVGSSTAIWSVVNAVVLQPLPFSEPDRLVSIWESNPEGGFPLFGVSHPNFLDWRAQVSTFHSIAAFTGASFSMASGEGGRIVRGFAVSLDFLPVLDVAPALGRNFAADEDRPRTPAAVAIVSHGFWHRELGADASVLGRTVTLDSVAHTVVGVLPDGFRWGRAPIDLLVPLGADPGRERDDHRLSVIGRLDGGSTFDRADADLRAVAARLEQEFPATNEGWTVRLETFRDWIVPQEIRRSLVVLLVAVGLVLLIACGNVANLLLARGAARHREFAIRLALGASPGRVVRQLLLECLLLAMIGAAAGLLVTVAATRLVVAFGPEGVPRLDEVSIDGTVLAFALASALASALIFGIVPAANASGQRPGDALHDASRGSTGGVSRQRLRAALTKAEVALSVALLIGAGLLLRSFGRLQGVDPGFDVASVMATSITLPAATYASQESKIAFYERLLPEIAALPGVLGAAATSGPPLTGAATGGEVSVPSRSRPDGARESADWRLVSPGYFAAMGIPLRSGRDFGMGDRLTTAPVAIVSEALAGRLWPGEDALGRTVTLHSFGEEPFTVIGIVGDVRTYGLDQESPPTVYGSSFVYGGWNPMNVVWRADDPASHVGSVPRCRFTTPAVSTIYSRTRSRRAASTRISWRVSERWPWCSQPSACSASWPIWCRSARARSECASRSAPTAWRSSG